MIQTMVKPKVIPSNTATIALAVTLGKEKKTPLAKALAVVRRLPNLHAGLFSPNLREETYDLSEWPTVIKTSKDGSETAFEPLENSYLDVSDVYDVGMALQETEIETNGDDMEEQSDGEGGEEEGAASAGNTEAAQEMLDLFSGL